MYKMNRHVVFVDIDLAYFERVPLAADHLESGRRIETPGCLLLPADREHDLLETLLRPGALQRGGQ